MEETLAWSMSNGMSKWKERSKEKIKKISFPYLLAKHNHFMPFPRSGALTYDITIFNWKLSGFNKAPLYYYSSPIFTSLHIWNFVIQLLCIVALLYYHGTSNMLQNKSHQSKYCSKLDEERKAFIPWTGCRLLHQHQYQHLFLVFLLSSTYY